MANKKTKPASCCSGKKVLPLLIIAIIVLVTVGVLTLPNTSPEEQNTNIPDVEMISDTVEVQPVIDILVAEEDEPAINPEVLANPVMKLDEPNVFAPPKTDSEQLVYTFLTDYNQKKFTEACDILVDTKCDATSEGSVTRFGEELEKMKNGYQNISVRQIEVPDFHSDIVCVEYDYRYKESSNTNPIHETMSFYVQDGKITYRICENKTRNGEEIACPIRSRRDFCLE